MQRATTTLKMVSKRMSIAAELTVNLALRINSATQMKIVRACIA
jgi:hypothetical protein